MQFMHFSAIFAKSTVLATLLTPWYPMVLTTCGFAGKRLQICE